MTLVRSTVCSNIALKVARKIFNFCQRNSFEYPKATYMHWRKLLVLFEPNYYLYALEKITRTI